MDGPNGRRPSFRRRSSGVSPFAHHGAKRFGKVAEVGHRDVEQRLIRPDRSEAAIRRVPEVAGAGSASAYPSTAVDGGDPSLP